MTREELIEIFKDTENSCKYDATLVEAIKKQNTYTQIIPEDKEVTYEKKEGVKTVKVTQSKTFDAARKYTDGKIAILNFASATTPGGGVVKGSTAQEECLCRCSTLYPSLIADRCWDNYYQPNRENLNAIHTDDIIWTPDVVVFKKDDYTKLKREEWKTISVLSCAAPNLREKNVDIYNVDKPLEKKVSDEELYKIHLKRAKKIFAVAAKKGVTNFVVGAFGCGAFKNDPNVVAKAWKQATDEFDYPMNIEYAIYDGPHSNNYEVFKRVFEA